jgi:hypothetical protein
MPTPIRYDTISLRDDRPSTKPLAKRATHSAVACPRLGGRGQEARYPIYRVL